MSGRYLKKWSKRKLDFGFVVADLSRENLVFENVVSYAEQTVDFHVAFLPNWHHKTRFVTTCHAGGPGHAHLVFVGLPCTALGRGK